jgi:hypothetical protein
MEKVGKCMVEKCTVGKSMAGMLGKCMWEKYCYKIHKEYCWENIITESWATKANERKIWKEETASEKNILGKSAAEINAVEKKVFGQIAWEKCKQKLAHCKILKGKSWEMCG